MVPGANPGTLKENLNPKDITKPMKKYTIIVLMLLGTLGYVNAQDASTTSTSSSDGDYAPAAGDISAAILFGRGNFLDIDLQYDVPTVPNANWTVPGTAPYANFVEANENPVTNIVGGEVRYFLMDNIALKLSGGAIMRNTPARANVPGIIDPNSNNASWIPAYAAVEADNKVDANINLGGEYHFTTKYTRLYPYGGLTLPFYYARRSVYNPTINYDVEDGSSSSGPSQTLVDVGVRSTQIKGFGVQVVGGVDYYLMEGLYFGFEIKPISVVYSYSDKIPAPGLESGQADNTTWSFFSQTFFKVGFRF
jgi:hypothetical protein